MRKTSILLAIASTPFVFGVASSRSAEETDSPSSITMSRIQAYELEDARLSLDVRKRYEQELLKNQGVILDRLGPPSYLQWTRLFNQERYKIHDEINSSGARAMSRLIEDSARETAVAILLIDQWKSFGELLLGSIGNTAEERSPLVSSTYSEVQRSRWQNLRKNGKISYGIRPWRQDPYIYAGTRFGHWGGLEDLPVLIFEGRLGYKLLGSSRLEGRATIPLPERFQFTGGIGTDPMRLHSSYKSTAMSARLEYLFEKQYKYSRKVAYVGAQTSSHETLIVGGCSFEW